MFRWENWCITSVQLLRFPKLWCVSNAVKCVLWINICEMHALQHSSVTNLKTQAKIHLKNESCLKLAWFYTPQALPGMWNINTGGDNFAFLLQQRHRSGIGVPAKALAVHQPLLLCCLWVQAAALLLAFYSPITGAQLWKRRVQKQHKVNGWTTPQLITDFNKTFSILYQKVPNKKTLRILNH